MLMKIGKWGNNLALRIPTHYTEKMGIQSGSQVKISEVSTGLLIEPVSEGLTLTRLLAQTTEEAAGMRVEGWDSMTKVGNEL